MREDVNRLAVFLVRNPLDQLEAVQTDATAIFGIVVCDLFRDRARGRDPVFRSCACCELALESPGKIDRGRSRRP